MKLAFGFGAALAASAGGAVTAVKAQAMAASRDSGLC
jgi:hypothetical protein